MFGRIRARLIGPALFIVIAACSRDAVGPEPVLANPLSSANAVAAAPVILPDGELVSITFSINHAACSGLGNFVFSLNDVVLGTSAATSACTCHTDELQVTLSGPEVRAAWNARKGAANTIAVATTGATPFVGYIRLDVVTAAGSATVPLFDAISGGSAGTRSLCLGFVTARKLFSQRFGPPPTLPPGELRSLTFFINHADCQDLSGQFTFVLNGVTLGTANSTVACTCGSDELQVTFAGADARSAWHAATANTISVQVSGPSVLIGYIRLSVETTTGVGTAPLFDAVEGGPATSRDLCVASVKNQPAFTATFEPTPPSNQPPVANAGEDQVAECVDAGVQVTLDGSASSDPDHDALEFHWFEGGSEIASGPTPSVHFGMGSHTVTLRVSDTHGASDEDDVVVNVGDTHAPTVSLPLNMMQLWPANHTMQRVATRISAADGCDLSVMLVVTVTSNEPINGSGDGNTAPDWEVVSNGDGTFDVWVRAERSGKGSGRIYTITATALDASGNAVSRTATVFVPHDRSGKVRDPSKK